jgi:hypothetical protein
MTATAAYLAIYLDQVHLPVGPPDRIDRADALLGEDRQHGLFQHPEPVPPASRQRDHVTRATRY